MVRLDKLFFLSFWRVPVAGGEEEEFIQPDHDLLWATTIQPTRKGVYYLEFERSKRAMVVSFYDLATRKTDTVFRLKNGNLGNGLGFSVSPDGKYILYP